MDTSQLRKDILKMRGDHIFELYSSTQKSIEMLESRLASEKEKLTILTDVLYKGKPIEEVEDERLEVTADELEAIESQIDPRD